MSCGVREIDERHTPTDRSDMFHDWNMGRIPARGDFQYYEPWMEKYKMKTKEESYKPPIEVARIISQGGVFQDGAWRIG